VTEKSVTITAKLCPASRRLVVEADSTGGPSGREAAALLAAVRATAKVLASEVGRQAGVGEAVTEMMLGHEGESECRITHGQLRVHTQRL
jgi:hypothetical protein